MTINGNVSLGDIIAIGTFLVTLFALHSKNSARIAKSEQKLDVVYRWFERHVINGSRTQGD